jgi:hypothetical protein
MIVLLCRLVKNTYSIPGIITTFQTTRHFEFRTTNGQKIGKLGIQVHVAAQAGEPGLILGFEQRYIVAPQSFILIKRIFLLPPIYSKMVTVCVFESCVSLNEMMLNTAHGLQI